MLTMSERELWDRLQRALHTRITSSEWRHLERTELVGMFTRKSLGVEDDEEDNWREFVRSAREHLGWLRAFKEDDAREQAGDLLLETEADQRPPEPPSDPDALAPLSDRTAARVGALIALDNYKLGPTNPDRVRSRTITSKVWPQGGFDETLPQWIIKLEIEAWVPPDDVRGIYQLVRRDLLAVEADPKTQARTYNVARFVWEEELRCGERPSWPVLLERWNERYPDDRFNDRRAFRMCFKRGEEATPPRYTLSNDHIASEARRLRRLKEQWEEGGPWFGIVPS